MNAKELLDIEIQRELDKKFKIMERRSKKKIKNDSFYEEEENEE